METKQRPHQRIKLFCDTSRRYRILMASEISLAQILQIRYHSEKAQVEDWLMNTQRAIAERIIQLCKERGITPNGLSNISAVPQGTIKSILNGESRNPGAVTIKKLCDGFEITLGEFYSTPEFDNLEQEIK